MGEHWIWRIGEVGVNIEHDDHGYYAYAPQLPGCQSEGDTLENVCDNIREAVELYLETLKPEQGN